LTSVRQQRHAGTAPDIPGFNRRVYGAAVISACGKGLTTPSASLADVAQFPLVLTALLPPDWQDRPMHQRLRDWELGRIVQKLLP
jgi:hypothetical protein